MSGFFDNILALLLSILDLLKGSLPFAILFFLLAIFGKYIQVKLQKRLRISWFQSALLVAFLFSLIAVSLAYIFPYIISLPREQLGEIPAELRPELSEKFLSATNSMFKVFITSIFFALLSMPFVFMASFIARALEGKKFNKKVALFISTYISTLIFFALFLFFMEPILVGVLYYLYSG
ncbi:MAG: hypothetical protein N3F05_04395 [Candidatus Diapherotrites archaeon]|nr:hypothetical protein [Candidatus Diapherotrites archaeon]